MLPRPVPELTRRQWEFIVERLDKPAPRKMQLRLQEALAAAREIKFEECRAFTGGSDYDGDANKTGISIWRMIILKEEMAL